MSTMCREVYFWPLLLGIYIMVGKLVKIKQYKCDKLQFALVISLLRGLTDNSNDEYSVYNVLFNGEIKHFFRREIEIIE